jgi:hypothetical protein
MSLGDISSLEGLHPFSDGLAYCSDWGQMKTVRNLLPPEPPPHVQ